MRYKFRYTFKSEIFLRQMVECIIEKYKIIQDRILEFLDDESDNVFDSNIFVELEKDFLQNRENIKTILYFLVKVSNNHKRPCNFFSKIEQIIKFFKDYIIQNFSRSEIVHIFQRNRRLILFLYSEGMIKIEDFVDKSIKYEYSQYFIPEIQSQLTTLLIKDEIFDAISIKFAEFYNYKLQNLFFRFNFLKFLKLDSFLNSNSSLISEFEEFLSKKF